MGQAQQEAVPGHRGRGVAQVAWPRPWRRSSPSRSWRHLRSSHRHLRHRRHRQPGPALAQHAHPFPTAGPVEVRAPEATTPAAPSHRGWASRSERQRGPRCRRAGSGYCAGRRDGQSGLQRRCRCGHQEHAAWLVVVVAGYTGAFALMAAVLRRRHARGRWRTASGVRWAPR